MTAAAGRETAPAWRLGPVALTALAVFAFLLALAGSLWLYVGTATFLAMVEAGGRMLCL